MRVLIFIEMFLLHSVNLLMMSFTIPGMDRMIWELLLFLQKQIQFIQMEILKELSGVILM